MTSFAAAAQLAPGKQNRRRFGPRGSTRAPKASPLDDVGFLALRPVMQATGKRCGDPT